MEGLPVSSRLIAVAVAVVFAVGVVSGAAAGAGAAPATRYTALTEVFQTAIDTAAVVVIVWAGSAILLPGVLAFYMASASIGVELAKPSLPLIPYYILSGWPQIAALLIAAYSGLRMGADLLSEGRLRLVERRRELLVALILALAGAPYSYIVSGMLGLA